MSYTINLYNFEKSENSTKQPTGSGTTKTCVIKLGSTQQNPSFRVNASLKDLYTFNYLKFLNQYYYIVDIESERNDVSIIHGRLDALATYKTNIGSYNAYITRSSKGYDSNLYDDIIKPSSEIKNTHHIVSTDTGFSLGSKTVVIGTSGCGELRSSATIDNYYYSTSRGVSSILADIFYNGDIFGIIQQMMKITDCLTTVKVFPFSKADTSSSSSDVYVGEFQQAVSGLETLAVSDLSSASTNGRYYGTSCTIALSSVNDYSDFRLYDSNFVDISLVVPFVGNISLQPWVLRYSTIQILYKVDMITGVGECVIQAVSPDVKTIGIYNCQIGFDVPSSAYVTNYAQIIGNVIDPSPMGAISNVFAPGHSVSTLAQASGSATVNVTNAYLDVKVMDTENFTYAQQKGKKVMEVATISTHSGNDRTYIECLNPSVQTNGKGGINQEINSYLERGFYYE